MEWKEEQKAAARKRLYNLQDVMRCKGAYNGSESWF